MHIPALICYAYVGSLLAHAQSYPRDITPGTLVAASPTSPQAPPSEIQAQKGMIVGQMAFRARNADTGAAAPAMRMALATSAEHRHGSLAAPVSGLPPATATRSLLDGVHSQARDARAQLGPLGAAGRHRQRQERVVSGLGGPEAVVAERLLLGCGVPRAPEVAADVPVDLHAGTLAR